MLDDVAGARVEFDLQLVAAAAYPESVGGPEQFSASTS